MFLYRPIGGNEYRGPDGAVAVDSDNAVIWDGYEFQIPGDWRNPPRWATTATPARASAGLGVAVARCREAFLAGDFYPDVPAHVLAAARWLVADGAPDAMLALRRELFEEPLSRSVREVLVRHNVLVVGVDGAYTPSHVAVAWAAHHGPRCGFRGARPPIVEGGAEPYIEWARKVCGGVPHTFV